MYVGILQVSLSLEGCLSLKEKRRIVRSVLDRIRAGFNVSAAEVSDLDLWQSSGLGFCAASNDAKHVRGLLQRVLNHLMRHREARVTDHQLEVI
ncbi:MAG: DUF503 domain-containing protein [Planctomycetaceae bacterium]